jgi:hypothetical protein
VAIEVAQKGLCKHSFQFDRVQGLFVFSGRL